ncbi:MAG: hypothetical protein QOI48_813, partial [Solirubrobacteraceae bacterium]|nr:hypothetical protein [Solirubrobacteraceae bacterium]
MGSGDTPSRPRAISVQLRVYHPTRGGLAQRLGQTLQLHAVLRPLCRKLQQACLSRDGVGADRATRARDPVGVAPQVGYVAVAQRLTERFEVVAERLEVWAILLAATVIFLTSFPIAYYSAKYSIDMDLITRGAGFGYFGGTVTSLVYASFTFIFFALEGSIMAQGLHLGLGIPLWLGYGFSALMIPPLVIFGMTLLSKMQMWTQPLWLVGMFL